MPDDTHMDLRERIAVLEQMLAERTAERDEAREHQTATSDVLNVISRSTADVQPVLDTVIEAAARLCGSEIAAIAIREGEVYRYVSMSTSAAEPEYWAILRERRIVPGRDSVTARVALEGRIVHVADIRADPDYASPEALASGRRTQLGVPLLRDSEPIGIIMLSRKRVEPFTERQIELVKTFADQAVIAMENARLLGELQTRTRDLEESLEYQTATSDVLTVISRSAFDLNTVLQTVVAAAHRLCRSDYSVIFRKDGNEYRWAAGHGISAEYEKRERRAVIRPGHGTIIGRAVLAGHAVQIADARKDPLYEGEAERDARTMLGVPLLRDGEAIGGIGLARNRVEAFTDREIELVTTFADQAVIAMENARLLGELQARTRDLEESLEYQTATSDVLNVISRSTADVQPVLDTVAETAARLCGADRATIFTREGEVYRAVSTTSADPEHWAIIRQRRTLPGRETVSGRVSLEGRVVQIADIRADPDFAVPEALAGGNRTMLGVPLLREGAVLGTINLSRMRVEPFTERQIELVRTFADQAVIAMENARLLGELKARTRDLEESLEYQTATSDVLNVISRSTADVQPVLDTVVETAARLCSADTAAIWMREGEIYRAVASTQARIAAEPEYWAMMRQRRLVPGRDSVAGRVLLEGRVVHVADIRADPDYALPEAVAAGDRTMLGVPLLREGAVLGTIGLSRKRVQPFTERQIELVRTFADQAVIAMENARLLGELQARTRDLEESLEYQTATSDVLQVISRSTFDLQPVLGTLVETAARLCDADMALIYRREGDVYRLAANWGFPIAYEEFVRQLSLSPSRASVTQRAALECRVSHVADITADPEYALPEASSIGGARTALGVPLLREGEPIGVFTLARQRVEPFSERQIELVRTFADQAVIAMENARLLSELQARTRDLEELLEYQTATSDVLQVISRSTFDLQPILDTVAKTAARLCEAEMVLIHRRDGEVYRLAVSLGFPPEFSAFLKIHPITPTRGSIAGRVALEGCLVQIADCASDPEYGLSAAVEVAKQRTALGVPLLRENAPIGIIVLARTRVEPFTERQIELVRTFADQAVIAMENARLLGELQARTRDLEELLEYQTATSDVLNVISRSTADVQPVLDTVAETACRLCGADVGAISIREGEVYRYVSAFALDAEYWPIRRQRTVVPGRETLAGRVLLEGKVCACRGHPGRPGLLLARECGGRATYHSWGAAAARRGRDRHDWSRAETGRAVHRAADRAGAHLRRPGGYRDRKCAAARRIAGPHRRADPLGRRIAGT